MQILTLGTIIFSAARIIDRNINEWRGKENRLDSLEQRLQRVENGMEIVTTISRDIAAILQKQTDASLEIERLRNRLDRFLDTRATPGT